MPLFGYIERSGDPFELVDGRKRTVRATLPADAVIPKLSAYLDGLGSGSGSQVVRGVVYDTSGALVGSGIEVTVEQDQDAGWVDLPFDLPVFLSAGDYDIGVHSGPGGSVVRILRLDVSPPYANLILANEPSLYWRLGANGLIDQSGNGRDGTAQGGVTVGGATGALDGDSDAATDFDGVNDRITSSYGTRRNGVKNPTAAYTGVAYSNSGAYWRDDSIGNNSIAQVTDNRPGSADTKAVQAPSTSSSGTFCSMTAVRVGNEAADALPCVAGQTVLVKVWVKIVSLGSGSIDTIAVRINFKDAAQASLGLSPESGTFIQSNPVVGTWYELQGTFVAPANTNNVTLSINWRDGGGATSVVQYVDDAQIEIVPAGASPSSYPYFDGSYPGNDESGWLGTAHASASDIGCFANGTVRTFVGIANRDTVSTTDNLFSGSDSTISGALQVQTNAGAELRFDPSGVGSNPATWASPGAPSTAGTWWHWVLVFDEPNNTAEFFINGVSLGSVAAINAWSSLSKTFTVGLRAGSSEPFDGKKDEVAVFEYGLPQEQITALYERMVGIYPGGEHSNNDAYADGPSDPFGSVAPIARELAVFATYFSPFAAPDADDIQLAGLGFADAQSVLGAAAVEPNSQMLATCGWHGTILNPERGSFALVQTDGPLADLVGDRVKITALDSGRSVVAYVLDEVDLDTGDDISVTRRLFAALDLLATEALSVGVETLS